MPTFDFKVTKKYFNYDTIDYDELTQYFKENGYVVIENLYTKEKCNQLISRTVNAFETINPDLSHESISSWKKDNLPPQTRTGMYQSLVCHISPVTEVRNDEKYKKIFREIYSRIKTNYTVEDDLVSSLDGINIKPNKTGPYDSQNAKDWAHIDQTKRDDIYKCIQGQVVLSDTTASFRCSPKSHLVFSKLLDICNVSEKDSSNWCKIPNDKYDKCKELVESVGGKWQIPIYAKAGSCILWLSTTVHSAKHSNSREKEILEDPWFGWRAVYYITYRPKNEFTVRQLDKIKLNIENNRVMNHWSTKTFPIVSGIGFYPLENYNKNIAKYINNPKLIYELKV